MNCEPSIRRLEGLLATSRKPIVHGFGLTGVLASALATRRVPGLRRVYTITGRGYAAASHSVRMRGLNASVALFNRFIADDDQVRWVVENKSDIANAGLSRANKRGRVITVGGAGVDPDLYSYSQMPPRPPLKIGFVSRLIWSKGLDTAVAAIGLARARGCDVTLTVAGSRDSNNPRAYTEAEIQAFARRPSINFVGHVGNIVEFWSTHHLCFLPSRGGEGLPKCLLEAASCGRPVLVSDVPGCAEFADATHGWKVGDVESAARAISVISALADLEKRGAYARSIVEHRYTDEQVWQAVSKCYFQ